MSTELRPRVFADSYTIEIVELLQEYLGQEENMGIKPHAVVFNIARSRVDANRKGCTVAGNDCACTEETPEKCLSVQQEYHDKIEEVKAIVNQNEGRRLVLMLFLRRDVCSYRVTLVWLF